jgi:hypothetical protein
MENIEISDKELNDIQFDILAWILSDEKDDIISSSKVQLSEESRKDLINILKYRLTPIQQKTFNIEFDSRVRDVINELNQKKVKNKKIFIVTSILFYLLSFASLYLIIEFNFYLIFKILLGFFSFVWFYAACRGILIYFKNIKKI